MSSNQVMEMSKVIGQIEDELRDIKSAKEQAEAVIGSNKALSDSLQALLDSASNVTKALENNTQQIIADINNKIEMLNIQASDIDRYAQQGVTKISEQSASAQAKLEDELGNLVQRLMGTISTSTNQSLEVVGNELAGYRVLLHEAAKKFTDSTSDANAKQEGHISEIGELVACIQERQYVLDSKIEELSGSLQGLLDSASNVSKALENNAQQIIADINNKIEMLNIQASDIDRYAQQGVTKISEQSALAQSKLEDELGNLVQILIGTISASANQSLEVVGNELAGYRILVHEATNKFTNATSDAITKQEGHITEIGELVACIQERQYALDSKIEELRQLGIVQLAEEISEIHRIESENATATRKWRVVELGAFGVCLVLGIAILIRLLVM